MVFPEDSEREGTEEGAAEDGGRMSRRNRSGRKGQRAGRSQWGCRSGVLHELKRDVHGVPLSSTCGTPRRVLRTDNFLAVIGFQMRGGEEDCPCNPYNAA